MAFGAYGRKGTVCAYYSRGFCRFGDRCWYEHPQPTKASPQTTGNVRSGCHERPRPFLPVGPEILAVLGGFSLFQAQ